MEELARNEDQPIVAENFKYEWYLGDELIEVEDAEEDDVHTPYYRNLDPTGMAHDHREEITIEESEEIKYPEVRDDPRVEVEGAVNNNNDEDLNEGQTEVTSRKYMKWQ